MKVKTVKQNKFCLFSHFARGVMRSAVSSYVQQRVYGRWFAPRARDSVRLTYRPSAALRLLEGALECLTKGFMCNVEYYSGILYHYYI